MESKVEFLRALPVFHQLPSKALADLAEGLEERLFQAGQVLCKEGEIDPWIYFIQEGTCRAIKKVGTESVELRVIRPREMMGLTSAFRMKPRSATLIAGSELKILALSHEHFNRVIFSGNDQQETVTCLLEHLASSVRRKNREMASLMKGKSTSDRPKAAVFDSKEYTRSTFAETSRDEFDLSFFDTRLSPETAGLAEGFPVVVGFVNDDLGRETLERLAAGGVQLLALRCAGFNNVDLKAAAELGITVTRVPAYSPHAVAEHSLALILALNRKTHKAYQRVRDGNFTLDGLVGFDLYGQTVGVVGTGKIGKCMVHILRGLGCRVLCYDIYKDEEIQDLPGVEYCEMPRLLRESKIVSLYVPLTKETYHLIDAASIDLMQPGAMLINTSRGGLIETQALIDGLKSGKIGSAGLDVYEEESAYFFEDFSDRTIRDDVLARLLTFNNVIVTSHQAFLTEQALANIAETTLQSLREFYKGHRGDQLTYLLKSPPPPKRLGVPG